MQDFIFSLKEYIYLLIEMEVKKDFAQIRINESRIY